MPVTGCRISAVTGHTDTQPGSTQCIQLRFSNAKPSVTLSLVIGWPLV